MLKRSVSLVLTQIQYIEFARLLAVGKQEKKTLSAKPSLQCMFSSVF